MIAALRLALADVRNRTALVAGAALLVAVPVAGFLLNQGFAHGIAVDFAERPSTDLIVQESNSVGEITGSRIPASVEDDLLDWGVTFAIPEIHSVAGSSADNAVLVRGVDPDRYRSVTSLDIVAGRPLQPQDGVDSVALGVDLADKRDAVPGRPVTLRGRTFDVVGIFEIGTYADNEAWLTLDGARSLLGWSGDEVSVFVIPDDGTFAEGDVLPGPLSVARRGDFVRLADEWQPILDLANIANLSLSIAASAILMVILWRLAWLRRRELAILRTVGMGRRVTVGFLAAEGTIVAIGGLVAGIAGGFMLGALIRVDAFGIRTRAVFDGAGMVRGVALTVLIGAFAVAVAGFRALRARPAEFLRGD